MADNKSRFNKLTGKQKKFCQEYIYDWNATRAYLKAYPCTKSPNAAGVNANRLLRTTKIEAYINDIQKDLEKTCGISKAKVLNEHIKLAFSSIAHLHNTWIERKEFEELTEDQKACISEISTQIKVGRNVDGELTENEYVKIKLFDKQKALDSITKLQGYEAPTKTELTGKDGKDLISTIKIEIINNADQVKRDDK